MGKEGTFEKELYVQRITDLDRMGFGQVVGGLGLYFVGYEVLGELSGSGSIAQACRWSLSQLKKFRVF